MKKIEKKKLGFVKELRIKIKSLIKNEYFRFYLISLCALFLVGMLFFKNIIIACLMLPLVFFIKKIFNESIIEKVNKSRTLMFKDLLYSFSSSFNLGRDLKGAFLESSEFLGKIYKEESWIITEVKRINRNLNEDFLPDKKIVLDFAKKSKNEFIVNFFTNYFLIRDSGFPITKLVDKQITLILEKIRSDNEVNLILSKKRNESKILSVFPIVLLVLLNISCPDFLSILYESFVGNLIMAASLALIVLSYFLSERITNIKL